MQGFNTNKSFELDGNRIIIHKMSGVQCVSDFISVMYTGVKRKGYQGFSISWDNDDTEHSVYPNACVPIAAIIEHYKNTGIDFYLETDESDYLYKCHFADSLYLPAEEIARLPTPFDRVFRYDDSAQVAAFTQKCIDYISSQIVCEEGVLDSLIWCINEVMDNVLIHSESTSGFVMAQIHSNNHVAICVADTGIGIFNSLKDSRHSPKTGIDALSLALQEGIGDGQGQGNGLYGLHQIIQANSGSLTIKSGNAMLSEIDGMALQKYDNLKFLSKEHPCTCVDFQVDLKKRVNLENAFSNIGGSNIFDIRIDDMLQENDALLYNVFDNCKGTATREAGRLLFNDVMNCVSRSHCPVCIDFSQVTNVSSSFIDEFIAKMVMEMGILTFCSVVTISGMNATVKYLCERSIYMRIHEAWEEREKNV